MDLFDPLVSWEWGKIKMECLLSDYNFQAVHLNGNVYLFGGNQVTCFDGDMKCQETMNVPDQVHGFCTLTTYQSKLVLVGGQYGKHCVPSEKLWSLQKDNKWAEFLSPMRMGRNGAAVLNTNNHLLVAGGGDSKAVKELVEVFDGQNWLSTIYPFRLLKTSTSTFLNGEWYVKGQRDIFVAKVDKLIAMASKDEAECDSGENVWRQLPVHQRFPQRNIIAFCDCILALGTDGGKFCTHASLHNYVIKLL